jgi:hypothetical protein
LDWRIQKPTQQTVRLDGQDGDSVSDRFTVSLRELLNVAISNLQGHCETFSFLLYGQLSLLAAVKQEQLTNRACLQRRLPIVFIIEKIWREPEGGPAEGTTFSEVMELDGEVEPLVCHESVLDLVQDGLKVLSLLQMRLTFLLQHGDLSIQFGHATSVSHLAASHDRRGRRIGHARSIDLAVLDGMFRELRGRPWIALELALLSFGHVRVWVEVRHVTTPF